MPKAIQLPAAVLAAIDTSVQSIAQHAHVEQRSLYDAVRAEVCTSIANNVPVRCFDKAVHAALRKAGVLMTCCEKKCSARIRRKYTRVFHLRLAPPQPQEYEERCAKEVAKRERNRARVADLLASIDENASEEERVYDAYHARACAEDEEFLQLWKEEHGSPPKSPRKRRRKQRATQELKRGYESEDSYCPSLSPCCVRAAAERGCSNCCGSE